MTLCSTEVGASGLSFRGQRELSTGLQLRQKDQNHKAISHCCQERSQLAKIELLRKTCHNRVKTIIHSTKLQIAAYLPKFLRFNRVGGQIRASF